MDDVITVRSIRNALRDHRFAHANEAELETGVEQVLTAMGLAVHRQVRLSGQDRIDVMTDLPRGDQPAVRLGIEIKVKGPADGVRRQLVRYAGHDQVDALVLVTTMYRHMNEVAIHTETCSAGDNPAGACRLLAGKPFELVLLDRGLI